MLIVNADRLTLRSSRSEVQMIRSKGVRHSQNRHRSWSPEFTVCLCGESQARSQPLVAVLYVPGSAIFCRGEACWRSSECRASVRSTGWT